MDEVGAEQFYNKAGHFVAEEDDAFGDSGADEVEGGGKDDYV